MIDASVAEDGSEATGTSPAAPIPDTEIESAVSDASAQAVDMKAVPSWASPRPGKPIGKVTGKTTDKTAGPTETASSEMPAADLALPAIVTDPATAVAGPAPDKPARASQANAPADAKDADPALPPSLIALDDPSVRAIVPAPAITPSPTALKPVTDPDEGSATAPKTDETTSKDTATLPSAAAPQPQPVALAVAAIPVVPPSAGEEGKADAAPVPGIVARTAVRTAGGPAAARQATAGVAAAKAPGAPVGAADDGEAEPVQPKPAGALAAGEAASGRPKVGVKSESGAQASSVSSTAPIDFAAHLAQLADPASALAAQPLPGAAATSATGSTEASRTATAVPIGDVPVEIGLRALDGSSRFDIRLSPEDLGRIDVKLDIDGDGQVRAHLVVDRPETLAFLQRDGESLHRAFEQAGFKPAESGIAFSLRDPGQDAGGGRNGSGENGQRAQPPAWTRQDRESAPDAVPTTWRTLHAGRSGIDLRI